MAVHEVRLALGGKERLLKSDLAGWAAIEDAGHDYITLVKQLAGDGEKKMKPILLLLWGYLQDRPRPMLDEVGAWVDADNFSVVTDKVIEAFRDGQPPGDDRSPPTAGGGIGAPFANLAPAST